MKIQKEEKIQTRRVDESPLYGLHHMHHFEKDNEIIHELHHCFLFGQKNMKGRRFTISHKRIDTEIYHMISPGFEGNLYDHANNVYRIKKTEFIDGKYYLVANE